MSRILGGTVVVLSMGLEIAAMGQAAPPPPTAVFGPVTGTSFVAAGVKKVVTLPVKRVSLYKNGVGFFEQSGMVSGNELVQLSFTSAQLNDALESLTAIDLGDGKIAGAGYEVEEPLAKQISRVAPGLGPGATMMDFFRAIKGARVEVHSSAGVFVGRVFNAEVKNEPSGPGGHVGPMLVEKRYLSVISDAGGVKTFELTPTVEVKLVGQEHEEIGRYLQVLSADREPNSMRHLTLEDRGTGDREVQVSYLSAVPAWKSSYRVLFGAKDKDTATLQGWAVVDNTGAEDWKDVQLTLVSGAPQSFIQQISRPLNVQRREIGMPIPGQTPAKMPAMMGGMSDRFDPIGEGRGQSVAMSASAIGGGGGFVVSQAAPVVAVAAKDGGQATEVKDYAAAAKNSLGAQTTSVDLGDLFEYKLSKPITIKKGESATVPILQAELAVKRVTVWNPHPRLGGAGPDKTMRSLWLTNTSDLTLDAGSFSIIEDGMFGGQGQIDLMHPKEKKLAAYAVDEAVTVDFHEGKRLPAVAGRMVIAEGKISVHRSYPRVREYTIHNTSGSTRTVVLQPERTDKFQMEPGKPRIATVWDLSEGTQKPDAMTDKEYTFAVEVEAGSTKVFTLTETHSHPEHYDLATIHEDELKGLIKEAGGNTELLAQLQPLLEAKKQLVEIDRKLKTAQEGMDAVKLEEKRIRENMAALPKDGSSALAKRYADEMVAQEDKMEALHKEKDALTAQHSAIRKDMEDKVAGMKKVDVKVAG